MKATLWDSGIDWEEIEDYELFLQLAPTLSKEKTGIIFGDVDFSTMQLFRNRENDEIVLMDLERDICIDRLIYEKIVSYLRKVHNLKRKVEKAKNKRTKQIMIQVDRDNMRLAQTKEYKSFMLPLISSVKVKMGYTRDYVLDMKIVEFMDDLQRLQIIDHAFHLSNGAYCGMVDTSKIPKEQMNWLREL